MLRHLSTPLLLALALLGCPEASAPRSPPILAQPAPPATPQRPSARPAPAAAVDDTQLFLQALKAQRSGVWMEVNARVTRTLRDDLKGDRHQRFLIDVAGRSVLVAHNIDLAKRAPVGAGDTIRVRGRYEYNKKGGVLHWTHHDPRGKKAGGFIVVGDTTVR